MAEKKERFGRYLILDHLVDGGMAKICRARFLSDQADKMVAIKMIQPQFSKNESFQKMFMSEIKVAFGLLHPNIVQTYDYGIHNKQLFVAMEYCDGKNLKEYFNRLNGKNFVFPVEISVYIISQACQGLHYAHTFTNKFSGKSANIIHRDISPHNIMLTYDGSVKVIDFGIAKADSNEDKTQVGTIKGKISYIAPEYIEGLELDHRYDQFAVGITLWELLCSRKLFSGPNELATLKKIQNCEIPRPSSVNPKIPRELDDIVMKILQKDRGKRFENMDQLNRSLIKFLYARYPEFNSSDLSYFAKELFKEEIKKDREKLFEYGKIDIGPYIKAFKKDQSESSGNTGTFGAAKEETKKIKERVFDLELDDKKTSLEDFGTKANNPAPKEKSYPAFVPGIEMPKNHVRDRGKGLGKRGNIEAEQKTKTEIECRVDGRPKFKILAVAGACAALGLFFKDDIHKKVCERVQIFCEGGMSVEKLSGVVRESVKPSGGTHLILKNFDKYSMKAYVNGVQKKVDILGRIPIDQGRDKILRVESSQLKPFVKHLNFRSGEDVTVNVPNMPKVKFGYLVSGSSCRLSGELFFNLYGEKRREKLPLDNRGLAFPVLGGRSAASTQYTLFYKPAHQKIKRRLVLNFDRADQRKNLCDLL